ncbi:Wzz/FepE/Etk N-terminal domain-containing protein [Mesorhizobium sp. M0684]|uniref:Wzz/FepE/Etk N-terminal domain-containing protein n=1 Tax=Mesorhizobium sp. M0684 TaxID=2956986 RepID=UPI003337195D
MLQRNSQSPATYTDERWPTSVEDSTLDLDNLLAAAGRQFRVIIAVGAAALALGTAFALTETPQYTASAELLIEYRQISFLGDSYLPNPLAAFDGIVSSEMEVLRSESVARHVIDALQLMDDPRFLSEETSPTWKLVSFVREQLARPPAPQEMEDGRIKAGIAKLKSMVRVLRVGPAFILRIESTAPDPSLAADIANAFAEGYLHDQRERTHESMRQAGEWLRVQVVDLRQKLADAELAVIRSRRTAADASALVALNALEREAETYRNLHASSLQRYQEALHQQTTPSADARIINRADTPSWTSYPPKTIILALSLLAGGVLGVGLGALFEFRDQGFRRGAQVRDLLHLDFLGMLPKVRRSSWSPRPWPRQVAKAEGNTLPGPLAKGADDLLRDVIDKPTSRFAECLRSATVAADLKLPDQKMRVIGVTSVLNGEGRSTAAKNLASLLAARGSKTLLIDADLTNPGLSEALAPAAEVTLADVVMNGRSLRDALFFFEGETGLAFLPASKRGSLPQTSDMVASPGFTTLLREAEVTFKYVIVDLPPMAEGIEARAAAIRIDAFICVIEWARTSRKLVQKAMSLDHGIREKCLGVIYSKVNLRRLRKYERYSSKRHFGQRQKTGFRV